ncbi:MAG: hypothetical protein ACOX6Z_06345, partial [Dethiobacteria bacterium]
TGGELDRQQEVKASLFYSCPREQERSAAPFCTGSERLERLWGSMLILYSKPGGIPTGIPLFVKNIKIIESLDSEGLRWKG